MQMPKRLICRTKTQGQLKERTLLNYSSKIKTLTTLRSRGSCEVQGLQRRSKSSIIRLVAVPSQICQTTLAKISSFLRRQHQLLAMVMLRNSWEASWVSIPQAIQKAVPISWVKAAHERPNWCSKIKIAIMSPRTIRTRQESLEQRLPTVTHLAGICLTRPITSLLRTVPETERIWKAISWAISQKSRKKQVKVLAWSARTDHRVAILSWEVTILLALAPHLTSSSNTSSIDNKSITSFSLVAPQAPILIIQSWLWEVRKINSKLPIAIWSLTISSQLISWTAKTQHRQILKSKQPPWSIELEPQVYRPHLTTFSSRTIRLLIRKWHKTCYSPM